MYENDYSVFADGVHRCNTFECSMEANQWTVWRTYSLFSRFPRPSGGAGGANLFAGTYDGVFHSTNDGATWSLGNTGLTDTSVSALAVNGTNLFAGTRSGVWRRPLSEMVTRVGQQQIELPTQFCLRQNFPNPFNPSTSIEFQVPNQSPVTLKIFDVLGREVATLVSELKQAGTHAVKWDATQLSSGVYFYSLIAGQFRETRRMILMK